MNNLLEKHSPSLDKQEIINFYTNNLDPNSSWYEHALSLVIIVIEDAFENLELYGVAINSKSFEQQLEFDYFLSKIDKNTQDHRYKEFLKKLPGGEGDLSKDNINLRLHHNYLVNKIKSLNYIHSKNTE